MNASTANLTKLMPVVPNPLSCFSVTAYIAIAGVTVPLTFLSVALYLGVLMTFLRHPALITPFTVHIMSLSVIGIIHGIGFFPQATARPISGNWLNSPLPCAIFQYFMWVLPTMTLLQDLVICADRWVAYLIPLWYHRHSSVKRGLLATMAVTVWLHGWYMPLNILNYYTPMANRFGCDGTAYPKYRSIVIAMVSYAPEVLIYGSYPVLLILLWRRRAQKLKVRNARVSCATSAVLSTDTAANNGGLSKRGNQAENSNNTLAMVLLFLKLTAVIFNAVPTVLMMVSATAGRYPPRCTWDAFHLSEQFLAFTQFLEPVIYLMTLSGLRQEFRQMFLNAFFCFSN
ncbi:hypothetical protein BV898_12157 [Hypsibius exemplaris]|uniref:G-protein coupled receptors family 1 profile domain-containing protein n=1 Tax=Hypsibius exemplaris TaxID=2072580 RepID=A0A1W0WEH2_HYPEX|nr:hypothetical protein BV898_12157 [Hypsibius exemplaris]